jgi:hypothetical protein
MVWSSFDWVLLAVPGQEGRVKCFARETFAVMTEDLACIIAHHKSGFFKAELSHEALSSGVKGGKGFDSRLHL